eukprot:3647479-Pyramimonas_sp.AAC.2
MRARDQLQYWCSPSIEHSIVTYSDAKIHGDALSLKLQDVRTHVFEHFDGVLGAVSDNVQDKTSEAAWANKQSDRDRKAHEH